MLLMEKRRMEHVRDSVCCIQMPISYRAFHIYDKCSSKEISLLNSQ